MTQEPVAPVQVGASAPAVSRVDAISLTLSVAAIAISLFGTWFSWEVARSGAAMTVVAGYATDAVARASGYLVEAGGNPSAYRLEDMPRLENAIAPLTNQMIAAALCMTQSVCNGDLTKPIFCRRAEGYALYYRPLRDHVAPQESGKPLFDYPFYDEALRRCPAGFKWR